MSSSRPHHNHQPAPGHGAQQFDGTAPRSSSSSVSGAGSSGLVLSGSEERIGDYIIGKEIGKGSFAVVRKGYRIVSHAVIH